MVIKNGNNEFKCTQNNIDNKDNSNNINIYI